MSVGRVTRPARAKLNLVLDLLGPRPDGYTEVATVLQEIELADEVTVAVYPGGDGITLTTAGEEPCPPEENLAWRAAALWVRHRGSPGRIEIGLTKRIPAGAGLGGGSSDAAAVLLALAELASPARPREAGPAALAAVAAGLGADVPFFLRGGAALGRGRGDELEPLSGLRSWPVVLTRAGRALATAEVYRAARSGLTHRDEPPNIRRFLRHLRETPGVIPPLGNDLLPAAAGLEPGIPILIRALQEAGGSACMTGSGSMVFALFDTDGAADAAAERMRNEGTAAYVARTRTVAT